MRKIILPIFLFLINFCGFTQIDKNTFSSQGGVYTTASKITVSQTVGQPSVIGTSVASNVIISQGYQHKRWSAIIRSNKHPFDLTVFPNPFRDTVSLTFDSASDAATEISLYTISGVLMFKGVYYQQGLEITMRFPNLPIATYMLKVKQNKHINYQQLIKI
jgi:hypothetical protein